MFPQLCSTFAFHCFSITQSWRENRHSWDAPRFCRMMKRAHFLSWQREVGVLCSGRPLPAWPRRFCCRSSRRKLWRKKWSGHAWKIGSESWSRTSCAEAVPRRGEVRKERWASCRFVTGQWTVDVPGGRVCQGSTLRTWERATLLREENGRPGLTPGLL